MQIVAVPLFDDRMEVNSYIFRYMEKNVLFSTTQAISAFDGGARSEALRILELVGLKTFTLDKPLFIPIKELNLLGDLRSQCTQDAQLITFVLEQPLSNPSLYLPYVTQVKEHGFTFAINYDIELVPDDQMSKLADYIFLSHRKEREEHTRKTREYIKRYYRNLRPIAQHIYSAETLRRLQGTGYTAYESKFYELDKSTNKKVSSLKANAIRLINIVQDPDFDFDEIVKIVRGDPALSVSLFRMVNLHSGVKNKITTIQHAMALLGQRDVRRWITTAVAKSMGADKPNELTRVSLVRAKFLENLAPLFELAHLSGELFLLGLFSVIDHILDVPMNVAVEQITVSDNIKKTLVDHEGIFEPLLGFVKTYERAAWGALSRDLITFNVNEDKLAEVYMDALMWYRDLVLQEDEPELKEE